MHFLRTSAAILTTLGISVAFAVPARADRLQDQFRAPPDSARPWVYLFPLDGNISSNGITADLEAMKRAGIGGVLYMETDQGAPKGPAKFAGPLWRDLFKHLCAEARRLGLQVNMNNDAGWCGSGGPWITPELSMQRVVWTETQITGPTQFNSVLPQPKAIRDYYRDIAVFAYPTPAENYTIPRFRGKSAEVRAEIPLRTSYPPPSADKIIPRAQLLNLTASMDPSGRVTWTAPAGNWTLLRLGHTSTGKDNHPAPLEGRGLECDKLSKPAAEVHFQNLMGKLIDDNKSLVGEKRTLVSTHIDSWEVGSQNWTPRFREEFQRLRGYDPLPFLPVMSGRVIDSVETSERFLWDVRQTVNDLLCDNYAGHFRTLAHRNGIRLSIEAYDNAPCDDLTFAGRADEPMAEFWSWGIGNSAWFTAYSCTEMASAAHVYGRPILGAEAFTATDKEKWQGHPFNVKHLGDWAFCEGINRFVFHRYALQPWTNPDRPPGMSMGPWGLHYERTQTWWEMSRAWHEYLARCQFLLQQGLFVADLCFLAPETSPQRFRSPVKSGYERPGYNFDACPPEALLTRMSVKNGLLTLPDGMNYRALVLPRAETMTPKLLRKVRDLARSGATIIGAPPESSPSLQDYPRCDTEVQALARELWGERAEPGPTGRPFGKGRVIWPSDFQLRPDPPYDAPAVFSSAKWIWFKEGNPAASAPPGKRFFRRSFKLDAPPKSASISVTADNEFELWVNGKAVGKGENFKQAYNFNVSELLKQGDNVLSVSALNTLDHPNPAAMIAKLNVQLPDGQSFNLVTDASWEAARDISADWQTTPLAKDGWSPALELGPVGMEPWGEIQGNDAPFDHIVDISIPSRVLAAAGVPLDFEASTTIRYIHKRIGQTDLYFLANPEPNQVQATCTFRIDGKQPELWHPDTGAIEPARQFETKDGRTTMNLRFEPSASLFVMFRKDIGKKDIRKDRSGSKQPEADMTSNWQEFKVSREIPHKGSNWLVTFDPQWGGPAQPVPFQTLRDWSQHSDPAVRHYSGTAIYRTTFLSPTIGGSTSPSTARLANEEPVYLDLGKVAVMAEVFLNGKNCGILWKPPFRTEITHALKPGENHLEIRVVNLWINRMIGDEQLAEDSDRNPNGTLKSWPSWVEEGKPSPTGRFTFTSWRLWKKNDPLVESGLLGPVTLQGAGPAPALTPASTSLQTPAMNQQLLKAIDAALADKWDAAHLIVQRYDGEPMASWIHAVLHKIEGDQANSRYWYQRAEKLEHLSDDPKAELKAIKRQLAAE